ncbi:winged helix-turn-helix domain-containing protein [Candidatus Enterococcus murrayae]|nr:helix-turn-helix domain-containing protein [Enterococcus sp. MJM16]
MGLYMDRVLILTKNILIEQELQHKLQLLNYEVYCSVRLFDELIHQETTSIFLNVFQYVIISESICESEVARLSSALNDSSFKIIRKVEKKVTEVDQHFLETGLLNAIISTKDSLDELRECLSVLNSLTEKNVERLSEKKLSQFSRSASLLKAPSLQISENNIDDTAAYHDVMLHLSHTESRLVSILVKAGNKIVSREAICQELWKEGPTKSHLASLSSTITRVKIKFKKTPLKGTAIHTIWGKGYRVDQELLRIVESGDILIN